MAHAKSSDPFEKCTSWRYAEKVNHQKKNVKVVNAKKWELCVQLSLKNGTLNNSIFLAIQYGSAVSGEERGGV